MALDLGTSGSAVALVIHFFWLDPKSSPGWLKTSTLTRLHNQCLWINPRTEPVRVWTSGFLGGSGFFPRAFISTDGSWPFKFACGIVRWVAESRCLPTGWSCDSAGSGQIKKTKKNPSFSIVWESITVDINSKPTMRWAGLKLLVPPPPSSSLVCWGSLPF